MDCHLPRLPSTSASHQNQHIKKMALVRMSAKLLVDARLHVSVSFPFLFFSFHSLSEIGKKKPIPSTVIFFVETDVV